MNKRAIKVRGIVLDYPLQSDAAVAHRFFVVLDVVLVVVFVDHDLQAVCLGAREVAVDIIRDLVALTVSF